MPWLQFFTEELFGPNCLSNMNIYGSSDLCYNLLHVTNLQIKLHNFETKYSHVESQKLLFISSIQKSVDLNASLIALYVFLSLTEKNELPSSPLLLI